MTTAETTTARLCPKCERPLARNGQCYPCARKSNRKCKSCGDKLTAAGRCLRCKPVGRSVPDATAILAHREGNPRASINRIARETGHAWDTVRKILDGPTPNGTGHAFVARAEDSLLAPPETIDPLDRVDAVLVALDGLAPDQAEKVLAVAARAVRFSR